MTPCAEFDPLVSAHATGALDATAAHTLELHLAGCERCRANLADTQAALDLARLPPVTDAERRSLRNLPAEALVELRRDRVGAPIWRAFAAGFATAAAIAVFIATPTQPPPSVTATQPPVAAAGWQEPDPDDLLAAVDEGGVEEAGEELARAELIADASYERALAEE